MFNLDWPWIVIIIGFLALIGARLSRFMTGVMRHLAAPPSDVMPVVVSIAVLGAALYVVLSGSYAEAAQKWAFGAIGTILGYWLNR